MVSQGKQEIWPVACMGMNYIDFFRFHEFRDILQTGQLKVDVVKKSIPGSGNEMNMNIIAKVFVEFVVSSRYFLLTYAFSPGGYDVNLDVSW